MYSAAEKRWFERDMSFFDKLPKRVREAIRDAPTHVDVYELKRLATNADDMVNLIRSGKAPR